MKICNFLKNRPKTYCVYFKAPFAWNWQGSLVCRDFEACIRRAQDLYDEGFYVTILENIPPNYYVSWIEMMFLPQIKIYLKRFKPFRNLN